MFGGDRLEYRAGQALVIGVDMPSIGRVVEATPGEPCVVLAFALDLATLRDVAEELPAPPRPSGEPGRGVLVTNFAGARRLRAAASAAVGHARGDPRAPPRYHA